MKRATDEHRARTVRIGGASKAQLLSQLQQAHVHLNQLAQAVFDDERFTTSPQFALVEVVELSAADLGLNSGCNLGQIIDRASAIGLSPCPLELGPCLRLQFTDQAEGLLGQPASEHRAPPGSITVVSLPLAPDDDDAPKGFYLRRIAGLLWLRGYRSWPGHLWSPEDRFVFCRARPAV